LQIAVSTKPDYSAARQRGAGRNKATRAGYFSALMPAIFLRIEYPDFIDPIPLVRAAVHYVLIRAEGQLSNRPSALSYAAAAVVFVRSEIDVSNSSACFSSSSVL
jgi:hypothetical protein